MKKSGLVISLGLLLLYLFSGKKKDTDDGGIPYEDEVLNKRYSNTPMPGVNVTPVFRITKVKDDVIYVRVSLYFYNHSTNTYEITRVFADGYLYDKILAYRDKGYTVKTWLGNDKEVDVVLEPNKMLDIEFDHDGELHGLNDWTINLFANWLKRGQEFNMSSAKPKAEIRVYWRYEGENKSVDWNANNVPGSVTK